jgi:hypothetical protein
VVKVSDSIPVTDHLACDLGQVSLLRLLRPLKSPDERLELWVRRDTIFQPKGPFPLERFAERKAESRAVFTGNGHCRCSFNRAKAFLDGNCL